MIGQLKSQDSYYFCLYLLVIFIKNAVASQNVNKLPAYSINSFNPLDHDQAVTKDAVDPSHSDALHI